MKLARARSKNHTISFLDVYSNSPEVKSCLFLPFSDKLADLILFSKKSSFFGILALSQTL